LSNPENQYQKPKKTKFFDWLLSKEAELLTASGKTEKAIAHLERCILSQEFSDKASPTIWLQLGELYLKTKNFSAATLCAYHNIRNTTKNTGDFHIFLWKTLEAQGLRTQAKRLIAQQIDEEPQNHAMHAFFSGLLLRHGEPDAALREIDLAIQLEPNTPWFKSHRNNIISKITTTTENHSTQH
jgi:tetratricopeptide (TPR) repeat protein